MISTNATTAFKAWMDELKLDTAEAAAILGISWQMARYYELGALSSGRPVTPKAPLRKLMQAAAMGKVFEPYPV